MNVGRMARFVAALLALALVATACGGDDEGSDDLTPIKLQLQWVAQSQFAGYYAAVDQGFYEDEGLDVTILEGAVEIVPQQVLASGGSEFAIAWVPKVLQAREQDVDVVNIAQVFQRSPTLQVSWADAGISSPADWVGKKVGNWGFGNELEMVAALVQNGIQDQVEVVPQQFDMNGLLNREIDAAQAMIYNEYAQLLETVNEETGELYQPSDFTFVSYEQEGTAMLQDAVWARPDWLSENEDTAEAFLRASFRGWVFCRDNFDDCVDIVLSNGTTLGESHQQWQLNEVNNIIWPSADGIGIMDQAKWDQTVQTSIDAAFITGPPTGTAFRTDLAEAAIESLEDDGVDVSGSGFTKRTVTLRQGGE